ncbi:hypothetical protein GGR56DRAFT_338146 [Xylariaceae sp. FL0804]|nr:hypothetical protein GGR56DRAFT_338146 [Xylariaceae sp. FL0804]
MATTAPPAGADADAAAARLAKRFEDFDRRDIFEQAAPHVNNRDSRNFVVEFGPEHARVAFDLADDEFAPLLAQERHDPTGGAGGPIRWINIWDPSRQPGAIAEIGKHYGFSQRFVQLMMLPNPDVAGAAVGRRRHSHHYRDRAGLARRRRPAADAGPDASGGAIPMRSFSREQPSSSPAAASAGAGGGPPKDDDLERGPDSPDSPDSPATPALLPPGQQQVFGAMDMDDDSMQLYLQLKNTVNYFSTDQTQKAICIGSHWLHRRPKRENEPSRRSVMPPKHWQWLALCNDHTVLSIQDRPSFETAPGRDDPAWQDDELKNIRANTRDVLLQLSKHGFDLYKRKPLSLNSVRRELLGRAETEAFLTQPQLGSVADEGTSNLFYYLFEDYVAAGPLKTAERRLEQMTLQVLASAPPPRQRPQVRSKSSDIIPTLHYLSKDLRELKHLFENYKNLIGKMMALGKTDNGHADDPHRVVLTDSALSRFERLGDRLQFLMLNTIEGYLEEISALSSTYFNLTQQKDSEATARLTRSATLLAKLSVFFLPISFLTSYFSLQIEDLYAYWTGTDYWYSFAVVASVSFVSLFFFGRLLMFFSDVMDDWATQIARAGRRAGRACGLNIRGGGLGDDDDDDDL